MRVLIIGGTGLVGRHVARALRDSGADVCVLTRTAARSDALPSGVATAVADLARPDSLPPAFVAIDAAFLASPHARNETDAGLAAVRAATAAGVQRFVYMSVAGIDACPHIPHFASKRPVEEAVRSSGLSYTLLRPSHFFQNDLALEDAIARRGVYPLPIGGVGVSRVDLRDVADAAANALLYDDHAGRTYTLAGPDELTGDEVATVYARQLGRPVRYAGDDLDAWAAGAGAALPGWQARDLRVMYAHFQQHGMLATDAELAAARRVVGHGPRAFEEFVAELAPGWRD